MKNLELSDEELIVLSKVLTDIEQSVSSMYEACFMDYPDLYDIYVKLRDRMKMQLRDQDEKR